MTLLNVAALAEKTGISVSTWNKRRLSGDTPAFLKVGRRVLYRWSDVEQWLDGKTKGSTSDA
ncbi:helix-turn-helix domain-containing protein [Hyphobacterium sp. HN65]|uniref:Helix-turn-helix domain-containing protein n=1 Tax=Hyphobacterium lacteum TaxID=3116575 RepID=A0ABU7LTH2_9PROT|nr:helix-turn-helix domain-containing protein [Hyphobacterium sp. HN65]MEE2527197.1 helix-turn-helix domain-containing protein [Hyphobacterium sp. HN65]